jgi:cobalamin biosynthetic protein CobC
MEPAAMKPVAQRIAHGGDLGEVMRRHPDAPRPWLDLSTGINPIPYPVGTLAADVWARLPSRDATAALTAAAAQRYGVGDPAMIVVAPGTQSLIQILPQLLVTERVAIVGQTYEEHQVSWRRHGHEVSVVEDLTEAQLTDTLVVVNPDNPTGRLIAAGTLRRHKGTLIVDESFMDFLPATASLAGDLPPNAIVLRSFGKTYGLAGLRLGFAIAQPDTATRLREQLGPWAVSGPALEIGRAALADDAWLKDSATRLERDGKRLDSLLAAAGFTPLGGTPLFQLVRHDDVTGIVQRLGRAGVHVRRFFLQPDRLRFGLPGNDADFQRLAKALTG